MKIVRTTPHSKMGTSTLPGQQDLTIPPSVFEAQLFHERGEARLRAERIEDAVALEPPRPLRVRRIGLLQVAHRARVVAQAERPEREVERCDGTTQRNLLRGSDRIPFAAKPRHSHSHYHGAGARRSGLENLPRRSRGFACLGASCFVSIGLFQ